MQGSDKPANGYKGTGIVFNIQRWAIQDGPGMRTTVFVKGCPLRCGWCSNPESQNFGFEIMTRDILCIGCGRCVAVCPQHAISIETLSSNKTVFSIKETSCHIPSGGVNEPEEGDITDKVDKINIEKDFVRIIDRSKGDQCLKCVEACPAKAIIVAGEEKTVREVMNVVIRDRSFYRRSKGGMTICGGEPLSQWEFSLDLLKDAKKKGIHTALDTTGFAKWKVFEKLLEYSDLVLYDVKHTNSEKHKKATGVPNELILENLSKAVKKTTVWIRRVIVPGVNDSDEEAKALAVLAASLDPKPAKISLLPYHKFGIGKYESLGREYGYADVQPLRDERVQEIKSITETFCDIKVDIGK